MVSSAASIFYKLSKRTLKTQSKLTTYICREIRKHALLLLLVLLNLDESDWSLNAIE